MPKMHLLQLRFLPSLWPRVVAAAERRRIPISQWIRSACVQQLNREGTLTDADATAMMQDENGNAARQSSVARPLLPSNEASP